MTRLSDRLQRLEAIEHREQISLTRIVITDPEEQSGVVIVRQPDGSWADEEWSAENEAIT